MEQLNKGEYTGEIISKMTIDDSIVTTTHYSSKKNNPEWHYHENLHICFVFQGGKAETIKETSYTQKNGSIFFYHAQEKHRWISPNPVSKSANIEIGQGFLNNYNLSEADIKKAIQQNVSAKTLMIKMQQEMFLDDENSSIAVENLLLELITSSKSSIKKAPNWVLLLRQLLHDNWNEQMTLQEMSVIVGAHPVTISKYFRKYFSCTLGEYQRKLKIEKSIQLIKESKLSLTEVAFLCGFTDQSHFIRNFKKMTGFLPKHFQQF
ncbi:MAG: helix-turn-helix transcriptional regulator [Flavobacteriaceae bacterium]